MTEADRYEEAANGVYEAARMFGGMPHGHDSRGIADVEFGNVGQAAKFIEAFGVWDYAVVRDPVRSFSASVVVQFRLPHALSVIQRVQRRKG
jgi:hypothetical protein